MTRRREAAATALCALILSTAGPARGQGLTLWDVGIGLGNAKPNLVGARFAPLSGVPSDSALRRFPVTTGLQVSFGWRKQYQAPSGTVNGFALGLPIVSTHRLRGLAVGLGLEADTFAGAEVALMAFSNGPARGVMLGGLAVGADALDGISFGAIIYAPKHIHGITAAGGMFTKGNIDGMSASAIALAGGRLRGIHVGYIAAGAEGGVSGVVVGGGFAGTDGNARGVLASLGWTTVKHDATGLVIGGVAAAAGGRIRGVALAGTCTSNVDGVALSLFALDYSFMNDFDDWMDRIQAEKAGRPAPQTVADRPTTCPLRIRGIGLSSMHFNSRDLRGGFASALFLSTAKGSSFGGVSVSPVNVIRGRQHGLTLGVVNYARELHGAQVGLLNVSRSPKRVLPLLNFSRR